MTVWSSKGIVWSLSIIKTNQHAVTACCLSVTVCVSASCLTSNTPYHLKSVWIWLLASLISEFWFSLTNLLTNDVFYWTKSNRNFNVKCITKINVKCATIISLFFSYMFKNTFRAFWIFKHFFFLYVWCVYTEYFWCLFANLCTSEVSKILLISVYIHIYIFADWGS